MTGPEAVLQMKALMDSVPGEVETWSDGNKLRFLAAMFDCHDAGVDIPFFDEAGDEVQRDLRRIANTLDAMEET